MDTEDDDDDEELFEKKFNCEHCNKSYENKRNLRRHMKEKTSSQFHPVDSLKMMDEYPPPIEEDPIEAGFKFVDEMIEAFYQHSSVPDLITNKFGVRSDVDYDDNKIISYYNRQIPHKNTKLTGKRKCPLCPLTTTNYYTWVDHLKYKHYGHSNYVCKWCGYLTSSSQIIRRHITGT